VRAEVQPIKKKGGCRHPVLTHEQSKKGTIGGETGRASRYAETSNPNGKKKKKNKINQSKEDTVERN